MMFFSTDGVALHSLQGYLTNDIYTFVIWIENESTCTYIKFILLSLKSDKSNEHI